jgi:hypothetical protein
MILVLRPDRKLSPNGCIFSVPIIEDDIIDIQMDLFDSHIRRVRTPRPPVVGGQRPDAHNKGGIAHAHEDDSSGLDSQSYDRIRQNFKCP